MISEHKKYKDIKYYTNKINQYILLIEREELTNEEKEIILSKLKKINEKMEFIKKAEELNIEEIKKKEKRINEERLLNQFKAYLTNKNIYLNFKENKKNISKEFEYVYECFEEVNKNYSLKKIDEKNIDKVLLKDITNDFYFFIKYFNNNFNNNSNFLFNIFLI